MTASVQQHVGEGVPHFAWVPEEAAMIPVGEHGATASEGPVHGTRDTRANRHHAATERICVGRFDQEVSVRRLDAVVHEAKVDPVTNRREALLEPADENDGP
jgi:hypothetical protein